MDKFLHFGLYVRVIGKIISRANSLVIIVLILLVGFCLSFRNLVINFSPNEEDKMILFNSSFELTFYKTITMMIGSLETEEMGINVINSFSFINFIIYGAFIYFISILMLNIFTGISIDEVSEMFKTADKDDSMNTIEFIIKIEEFKNIKIFNSSFNLIEIIIFFPINLIKFIWRKIIGIFSKGKQDTTKVEDMGETKFSFKEENDKSNTIKDELNQLNIVIEKVYVKTIDIERNYNYK
ncbi:unnamed protein product [Brachionus calyciflorus]|uniref:Ion transport domain-containing protein n=1 Tax=Brachionus calyciflorus TaxID=104777 RepID=A0A814FQC9_9BILA|nr:unnamed protein product [Brachionus calyciflorus]